MKAAFISCLQPTTRRPSACAPASTSIIGPATTPKTVSIPAARSCRAAMRPPSIPRSRSVMSRLRSGKGTAAARDLAETRSERRLDPVGDVEERAAREEGDRAREQAVARPGDHHAPVGAEGGVSLLCHARRRDGRAERGEARLAGAGALAELALRRAGAEAAHVDARPL